VWLLPAHKPTPPPAAPQLPLRTRRQQQRQAGQGAGLTYLPRPNFRHPSIIDVVAARRSRVGRSQQSFVNNPLLHQWLLCCWKQCSNIESKRQFTPGPSSFILLMGPIPRAPRPTLLTSLTRHGETRACVADSLCAPGLRLGRAMMKRRACPTIDYVQLNARLNHPGFQAP
jgi:hypothetical protein